MTTSSAAASWARAIEDRGLHPRIDEPLARHGFWRIGGPADLWVELPSAEDLRAVMALGAPLTVMGNGSNLLVADAGIRGITVKLTGDLRDAKLPRARGGDAGEDAGEEPVAIVGAGMMNTVLLARLASAGLGGLGCLAGVPGTVGGAVRMNAGTHLGEVGDRVRGVDVVLPGGKTVYRDAKTLAFAYRNACLPPGSVLSAVHLVLDRDPQRRAAEQQQVAAHLARRKATQPLDQPSCGSVFRNPPGEAAGRLIERAGLKGTRRGGAQISPKHANFIVNKGGATAEDCWWLIKLARDTVWARFGIRLEPEVHAVGDWPAAHWPLPEPS